MSTVNFSKMKQIIKFACRMKKDHDLNIPVLVWGKHGIGKTEGAREVAKELGYECVTLNLANQTPEELLGLQKINGDEVKYYRPEWLKLNSTRPVIYFLDELLRAPTFVTQCMFNFILEGRLHTHQIRPCDMVIAANNPDTDDYIVQSFQDKAFESRFAHIYLEPNVDEVMSHFNASGCHDAVTSMYKDDADLCKVGIPYDHRVHVTPNNRMMKKVGLLLNTITETELNDFGTELIFSMVGTEAGSLIIGKFKETLHIDAPEDILTGKPLKLSFMDVAKINITNSRLAQHLKDCYNALDDKKPALDNKRKDNLLKYMHAIPKDCATAFLKELKLKVGEKIFVKTVLKFFDKETEFVMKLMEI